MIRRKIGVTAFPLMLMLAGCAGEPETNTGWSAASPSQEAAVSPQAHWPNSAYPALSWEDREAIGRITYAEAGNQGEDGIAAVIFTILNRVNSGEFGSSVQEVIDAPNQFEPATSAGGWRYLSPLDSWQSVQFDTILNLILAGRLPDLTNGALYFQNAQIVAARAARGRVSPYLVDFGGTPPVAEIGDHRFYDWRAGINLAARRQEANEARAYVADEPTPQGYAIVERVYAPSDQSASWSGATAAATTAEPYGGTGSTDVYAVESSSSGLPYGVVCPPGWRC